MGLFALFHAPTRTQCDEFNFVLQSVNVESNVVDHEGQYYLLVDERVAEQAYKQLRRYVLENAPSTVIARPLLPLKKGFVAAYLYSLILLAFSLLENTFALGYDWHQRGLADSFNIEGGQWWLSITALTLHADSAHLAGNIGFGVLFGLLVSQYIGSAAAWFSILIAGSLGNLLNAYLHQGIHQSLGASTAVFAALGMLGIFALNNRQSFDKRKIRHWLPFVATLALLVFTGTAGERTDILAHLFGYISGCGIALIWLGFGMPQINSTRIRASFFVACIGLISISWQLALS